ncbi:hypothetical protein YC2023_098815 [Brassica napus]
MGNSDELGLCLWLLPNDINEPAKTNFEFMFADYDRLIDFEHLNYVLCFDLDFCISELSAFTYPAQSINHNIHCITRVDSLVFMLVGFFTSESKRGESVGNSTLRSCMLGTDKKTKYKKKEKSVG